MKKYLFFIPFFIIANSSFLKAMEQGVEAHKKTILPKKFQRKTWNSKLTQNNNENLKEGMGRYYNHIFQMLDELDKTHCHSFEKNREIENRSKHVKTIFQNYYEKIFSEDGKVTQSKPRNLRRSLSASKEITKKILDESVNDIEVDLLINFSQELAKNLIKREFERPQSEELNKKNEVETRRRPSFNLSQQALNELIQNLELLDVSDNSSWEFNSSKVLSQITENQQEEKKKSLYELCKEYGSLNNKPKETDFFEQKERVRTLITEDLIQAEMVVLKSKLESTLKKENLQCQIIALSSMKSFICFPNRELARLQNELSVLQEKLEQLKKEQKKLTPEEQYAMGEKKKNIKMDIKNLPKLASDVETLFDIHLNLFVNERAEWEANKKK